MPAVLEKKFVYKSMYADKIEMQQKKQKQGYTPRGDGDYTTDDESQTGVSEKGHRSPSAQKSHSSTAPTRFDSLNLDKIGNLQISEPKKLGFKECAFCRASGEPEEVYLNHL